MKKHTFIQISAILGALAVGIGAFGAHGLQPLLEANARVATFETAVQYHFYHALAMLAISIWYSMSPEKKALKWAMGLFLIGILIFSGSLYILSLSGITWLGAITPIGGVAFIIAWITIIFAAKS
ncbi:DUF423 domain-containing protein [Cecembia sp.]|uniref:DUF423 domain-containing protein n=1 Tax=Cecembia sp. TaxID=1898110 RepID=UPI0025C52078|nr:DUF423 domain-containing protein [Cecembia sp.]